MNCNKRTIKNRITKATSSKIMQLTAPTKTQQKTLISKPLFLKTILNTKIIIPIIIPIIQKAKNL